MREQDQALRHASPWPRRPLRPKRGPENRTAGLRSLRGHGTEPPEEEENHGLRVGQMKVSKVGQIRLSNASLRVGKRLCHNCDTIPVFAAKTDSIDRLRLLILRNLLKTHDRLKIPAYRLIRHFPRTVRVCGHGHVRREFSLPRASSTQPDYAEHTYEDFCDGDRATEASLVRTRKTNVSCR